MCIRDRLYICPNESDVIRSHIELKGFQKIYLHPGEEKEVIPVSYTHLDVYKRQIESANALKTLFFLKHIIQIAQ